MLASQSSASPRTLAGRTQARCGLVAAPSTRSMVAWIGLSGLPHTWFASASTQGRWLSCRAARQACPSGGCARGRSTARHSTVWWGASALSFGATASGYQMACSSTSAAALGTPPRLSSVYGSRTFSCSKSAALSTPLTRRTRRATPAGQHGSSSVEQRQRSAACQQRQPSAKQRCIGSPCSWTTRWAAARTTCSLTGPGDQSSAPMACTRGGQRLTLLSHEMRSSASGGSLRLTRSSLPQR